MAKSVRSNGNNRVASQSRSGSAETGASESQKGKQQPQPNWIAFMVLNFVVAAVFMGTLSYVFLNYRTLMAQASASPLTSIFFPIMIVWSMCLVYFFGFFGISFLDTKALTESPSSFGLQQLQQEAEQEQDRRNQLNQLRQQPRNDTPICAEKPAAAAAPAPVVSKGEKVNIDELNFAELSNEQVFQHLVTGTLKDHQLEKKLGDYERAVLLRRQLYEHLLDKKLDSIPYTGYDYNKVFGANCEIVVGYVPIPLGVVGPLTVNGRNVYVPMATTEGCLVASANRGCKAISVSGGASAVVLKDAITRAPCIRMPSAMRAAAMKEWVELPENYTKLEEAFNSTTNYGRLDSIAATVAGRNVFLRFACMAGDAMGMNMVSKGCLKAIEVLETIFPDLTLVAISGNMCTDKKPSAINWILGRGKSVVVEAIIPDTVVRSVLKSTVYDMIEVNKQKNHIGSAMAGSIGGFNAQAANIVTAIFLATGQDPAQNVESSNCITILEYADDGVSLHMSVTMPSIEVGTVGGGTHLPAQAGCLDIMGVRGASKELPGDNARSLAMMVGACVMAGELSLIAALAANQLVQAHMVHNRKPTAALSNSGTAATGTTAGNGKEEDVKAKMRKNASMPDLKH